MRPLPLKGGVYHRPAVPFPRKGPVKKISLSRLEGLADIVLIKKCNRRLAGTVHDPPLGQLHPLSDIAGAKGFCHYGGKADRRVRRKPGNAFPHRAVLILPGKIGQQVRHCGQAQLIQGPRPGGTHAGQVCQGGVQRLFRHNGTLLSRGSSKPEGNSPPLSPYALPFSSHRTFLHYNTQPTPCKPALPIPGPTVIPKTAAP